MRIKRRGAFGLIIEIESHPHHNIPCLLPDGNMRWCSSLDSVLQKIHQIAPDDYAYLCAKIHHIEPLDDDAEARLGTEAAFYPSIEHVECGELTVPVGNGWLVFDNAAIPIEEH
jgi:hypothetical protein